MPAIEGVTGQVALPRIRDDSWGVRLLGRCLRVILLTLAPPSEPR
ncbi:Hypothetical protein A7982_07788 [Minicystis rosea]|nr:Hypothetical protein A7982_07788 [Minicystis rosea]